MPGLGFRNRRRATSHRRRRRRLLLDRLGSPERRIERRFGELVELALEAGCDAALDTLGADAAALGAGWLGVACDVTLGAGAGRLGIGEEDCTTGAGGGLTATGGGGRLGEARSGDA